MKRIQSLELWYINRYFYLRAYSITTAGLGDCGDSEIHRVSEDELQSLPDVIMKTFGECKQGIPHPDHRIKEENKLLKVVGLKTEKALMKEGKTMTIFLKEDHLKISPYYYNGKYLTSTKEMDLYCSLDPDDLIKTVLEGLKRCETPA